MSLYEYIGLYTYLIELLSIIYLFVLLNSAYSYIEHRLLLSLIHSIVILNVMFC